jgi:hypothetical protein
VNLEGRWEQAEIDQHFANQATNLLDEAEVIEIDGAVTTRRLQAEADRREFDGIIPTLLYHSERGQYFRLSLVGVTGTGFVYEIEAVTNPRVDKFERAKRERLHWQPLPLPKRNTQPAIAGTGSAGDPCDTWAGE